MEFESNLLSVTSVDIQSVEPVDQKTKDSLMKSVQLAIEITTNAQEATAKHEAQRIEQEAKVCTTIIRITKNKALIVSSEYSIYSNYFRVNWKDSA